MPTPLPTPTPGSSTSGGLDLSSLIGPALTAAVVAGLVSLIQIVVTGRRETNKNLLEFRLRRVNELYAPILLLLAEDFAIVKALREASNALDPPPGGARWHLLDNLATIRADPQLREMAERIAQVNLEIKGVLTKNAGLSLAKELPTSFHDFIAHADLVSRAIQTGVTPPNIRPKYFPKEFERDIKRAHAALVTAIVKQLGRT